MLTFRQILPWKIQILFFQMKSSASSHMNGAEIVCLLLKIVDADNYTKINKKRHNDSNNINKTKSHTLPADERIKIIEYIFNLYY